MLGSNARIHITRSSGVDFSGTETFYSVRHGVPARLNSRRNSTIDQNGAVVATDADLQTPSAEDVQIYDVIEVLGSTKKYRVITVEDVQNAAGRVVAYDIRLSRAEDLE